MDAEGTEFSKSKGHEFIVLPKHEDERWGKLCLSVRDEYVAEMKQNGLPGEEAL